MTSRSSRNTTPLRIHSLNDLTKMVNFTCPINLKIVGAIFAMYTRQLKYFGDHIETSRD